MTVQEGCDKFCSFCVVPYTRGAEASRPVGAVLDEIARLAGAGVREITLLGQNVNAYHGLDGEAGAVGLAALIRAVAAVPGIAPRPLRDLASERHERRSHRGPSRRSGARALSPSAGAIRLRPRAEGDEPPPSRRRLSRHRRARARARGRTSPSRPISSSAIPGETDADFEQTLALVRAVGFASSYAFKYSARPGTPAAEVPDRSTRRSRSGGSPSFRR